MADDRGFVDLARAWIRRNPDAFQEMIFAAESASEEGRSFSVRDWLCIRKFERGCNRVEWCDYAYPHDATHDIARYLIATCPETASVVSLKERDDDAPLVPLWDDAA